MEFNKVFAIGLSKRILSRFSRERGHSEGSYDYLRPIIKLKKPLIGAVSLAAAYFCENLLQSAFCYKITKDDSVIASLCRSACRNDLKAVEKLVKNGADVNGRHVYGWTPLHSACANGNLSVAEYLIKNGADVNALDKYPGAARLASIVHADIYELSEIRRQEFGDSFSLHADFTNFTPLHYAVFTNNRKMVELLLQSGSDTTLENSFGDTPLNLALTDDLRRFLAHHEASGPKKVKEIGRMRDGLTKSLKEALVGQEEAIESVVATIARREGGWIKGDKPMVFLFLGSSGVGKTELAKKLAKYLFGECKSCFIRIDMSEYQHSHESSKLIGAPPGYVGYDQPGQLTSKLRQCSDAIVLLDEIEKAHPDILTIFLQLFDEGRITDGQGQTIECPNAIFIMTSNLASEEIMEYAADFRQRKLNSDDLEKVTASRRFKEDIIYPILKRHFKRDEFLGRINDMVYFFPFTQNELRNLISRELDFWADKAMSSHGIDLTWDESVVDVLCSGYDSHYGARSLAYEVERRVVSLLAAMHEKNQINSNSKAHLTTKTNSTKDGTLASTQIVLAQT